MDDVVVHIIDLDPEEREDIERAISLAIEQDAYLHIELRKKPEGE